LVRFLKKIRCCTVKVTSCMVLYWWGVLAAMPAVVFSFGGRAALGVGVGRGLGGGPDGKTYGDSWGRSSLLEGAALPFAPAYLKIFVMLC
jgi:hypothetical protein